MNTIDNSAVMTKLETVIGETMQEHHVPGISLGIVKDGRVEYSSAWGVADVETGQPVRSESVYLMMSIGKPFVTTAIMQLVEAGKIDLNAPLVTYLPYFRLADSRGKAIMIHQMLSHTSGLPAIDMPSIIDWWRETAIEEDDASAERYVRSMSDVTLQFDPGEEFAYSDIAFDLLGQVITEVSGQSFETYMHDHIFAPLGMNQSTFLRADVPSDMLVQPHVLDDAQNVIKADIFPYTRWHAPSTELFSNVPDMTRWMLAHLNRGELEQKGILCTSSHEQLWAEHTSTGWMREYFGPACRAYGYGWFLGELHGHRVIWHGGADLGFHANLLLAPDAGLGIVAMGNRFQSFEDPANFYLSALSAELLKIL